MFTKLMIGSVAAAGLAVGAIGLTGQSNSSTQAGRDCCAQDKACCNPVGACCSTGAQPGCCERGAECCEDVQACCTNPSAVAQCCIDGDACCDEGKDCCDGATVDGATEVATAGACCDATQQE